MTAIAQKLEEEFKNLSPNEQAELYDRLGNVLYGDDAEDDAYIEILKRRVEDIESRRAQGMNAFQALKEM